MSGRMTQEEMWSEMAVRQVNRAFEIAKGVARTWTLRPIPIYVPNDQERIYADEVQR